MAFRRPHPRQIRICEEYKAKLEEENYHLRSELQTEVDSNHQNEKQINVNMPVVTKKDVRNREKYVSDLEKHLEKSEKQVDRLRCRIRAISSQKNTSEWENFPDLYNPNINLEMANITELANAIDGYVENRTTARDILIDQIKRVTRSVRQKENILHQDLIREQKRCYDAEAEWDLAIT
ncbi:hypothetical protein RclHR1_05590004 [Rhizophagus clarus]|uniref:Uncharacterized protein n=1 Tax=Rhizophagus clarus TaxID=94130 RepID=A0A2Z6SG53_9GLOM|nr:hypothetical protein RclHR1_05590004 [Rhizophagus clarus]